MNDNLRSQIYRNLDLKETDELLDIWKSNDHVAWSDMTFEVLEDILKKRIDNLPAQNEPIMEYPAEEDDKLEDWEAKLLDNENQPEFYDTLEVISLNNQINKFSKIYILVFIGFAVVNLNVFQGLFMGIFPTLEELPSMLLSILITTFASAIEITIVYLSLKSVSQILRILMEMEFNSRGAKSN
jgi:hypothetical protein